MDNYTLDNILEEWEYFKATCSSIIAHSGDAFNMFLLNKIVKQESALQKHEICFIIGGLIQT